MHYLHHSEDIVNDRYRIISLLGKGGMAETYAAIDITNSQSVAIKVLSLRQLQDWKLLELFEREAQILSHLDHASIPSYLDYFNLDTSNDRLFYLVRELIEGQSLADWLASGGCTNEAEIRQIAIQVLETLVYLHRLQPAVIHRDIKPENLIRTTDGRIVLVDFGSIQAVYHRTVASSTFVGTLGYMPPEQLSGKVVPASDLYGLGATVVFLLTGRSPVDLPMQRLKLDFRGCVEVSEYFANWLEIMLEPAVEDRFRSAQAALAFLRNQTSFSSKPPEGSKIKLERTADQLIINIPATGLNASSIYCVLLVIALDSIVLKWTMTVLSMGEFLPALFSLPFWYSAITLSLAIITCCFTKTQIELNPRTFSIKWQYLIYKRQVEGTTKNLRRATIKSKDDNITVIFDCCSLYEGTKEHNFGVELNLLEKKWLVAEISDYLDSIRSIN